jgi:hypothetical protein
METSSGNHRARLPASLSTQARRSSPAGDSAPLVWSVSSARSPCTCSLATHGISTALPSAKVQQIDSSCSSTLFAAQLPLAARACSTAGNALAQLAQHQAVSDSPRRVAMGVKKPSLSQCGYVLFTVLGTDLVSGDSAKHGPSWA